MTKIDNIIYSRKELLEKIKIIIDDPSNYKINEEIKFLSIVIDGKWGSGKTTFINQIMQTCDNYIYFDSWKHDFLNDPFSSIVDSILYKFKKNNNKRLVIKCINNIKKYFLSHIYIEICNIKVGFKLKEKNYYKNQPNDWNNEIISFQKEMNIFLKKPLIIFIDELDRCKPSFAMNLIEILKHLLNVENIIIIFSLNWKQLHNSFQFKYGLINDINEFYLDKIVDWKFSLPKFNNEKYLNDLLCKNCLIFKNNKDNLNDFVNWVMNTQGIDTLRDVFKKFSKWYINWKTRFINSKKQNFYLSFEKIIFDALNKGTEESIHINKTNNLLELWSCNNLLNLVKKINDLVLIDIGDKVNPNLHSLWNIIVLCKEAFQVVKTEILEINENYDLSSSDLRKICDFFEKDIYNYILKFDLNTGFDNIYCTIPFRDKFSSGGSTGNIYIVKKKYLEYFKENESVLNSIINDMKFIPHNIHALISKLLKN